MTESPTVEAHIQALNADVGQHGELRLGLLILETLFTLSDAHKHTAPIPRRTSHARQFATCRFPAAVGRLPEHSAESGATGCSKGDLHNPSLMGGSSPRWESSAFSAVRWLESIFDSDSNPVLIGPGWTLLPLP